MDVHGFASNLHFWISVCHLCVTLQVPVFVNTLALSFLFIPITAFITISNSVFVSLLSVFPPLDCAPLEDRAQGCCGHCWVPSTTLHTVGTQ